MEDLRNYLVSEGYSVVKIDYKALGQKHKDNVYIAVCKDYGRYLFLEWKCDSNYPSVKVYIGYNKSNSVSRSLIGYPYAKTLDIFKDGFKDVYIDKRGFFRWFFRPIIKPFFKYIKVRDINEGAMVSY